MGFIIGMFIGAILGVFIMAMVIVGDHSDNDK